MGRLTVGIILIAMDAVARGALHFAIAVEQVFGHAGTGQQACFDPQRMIDQRVAAHGLIVKNRYGMPTREVGAQIRMP